LINLLRLLSTLNICNWTQRRHGSRIVKSIISCSNRMTIIPYEFIIFIYFYQNYFFISFTRLRYWFPVNVSNNCIVNVNEQMTNFKLNYVIIVYIYSHCSKTIILLCLWAVLKYVLTQPQFLHWTDNINNIFRTIPNDKQLWLTSHRSHTIISLHKVQTRARHIYLYELHSTRISYKVCRHAHRAFSIRVKRL